MKTGLSLTQLATEIERQANAKKDFIADTRGIEARTIQTGHESSDVALALKNGTEHVFPMTNLAHQQVALHTSIPQRYYDRMRTEAPELLAQNINRWMGEKPADAKVHPRRLIRVLDGNVRAFLSDRYRSLDYIDLAEAVLPVLMDLKLEIHSCNITQTKLYIKAVSAEINKDIPTGRMGDGKHTIFDTCSPAIVISNSEVGMGSLAIETAVWTRACTNLAIFSQRSMRKYHVGGKAAELGEQVYALLADETKKATDKAVWMQTRDLVKAAFDRAQFDALAETIATSTQDKIDADPVKVVEVVQKHFTWTEGERGSVLKHLIQGGDLTRYGLANAITRTAEDLPDYDRATQFEQMGGQLIELPRTDWKRLVPAELAVAA